MNRFTIEVDTRGNGDTINLSVALAAHRADLTGEGLLHLFVPGSTASITTVEFEDGLVRYDLPRILQQIAPADGNYKHEQAWQDDNGHSHVRATLLGAGLLVPYSGGKLLTGEWQHVVLIDSDTRPRRRKVICTAIQ